MNEIFESRASFSYAFEGSSDVNAAILGSSLSSLSSVVDRLVSEGENGKEYSLKVTATRKGSFVVDLSLMVVAAQQLIPVIQGAGTIISITKGILDIKKALKGEKPKDVVKNESENVIEITSPDGSHLVVPAGSDVVFRDPKIDRDISAFAHAVYLHNKNGGLRLTTPEGTYSYGNEDVQAMMIPQEFVEFSDQDFENSIRVTLPVHTVALKGHASWKFTYAGRTITAKIADTKFLNSVHSGGNAFKAGDMLDVLLNVKTKQSNDGRVIGESHQILRVFQVIQQSSML